MPGTEESDLKVIPFRQLEKLRESSLSMSK